MFGFLKNHICSIGVDICNDSIRLAQLSQNPKGINLIAISNKTRPDNITPGSANWQRWAIDTIHQITANGNFRGRDITAAIPTNEIFIDHIRKPKIEDGKLKAEPLNDAIFLKIKQKLPFMPTKENTLIKCIEMQEDNILVMATERKIIDRHLAIYEKANLQIKSIVVWPLALTNCYAEFFGRRKSDVEVIVMLLNIEMNYTNITICRHKNLLFARSIPIGTKQLSNNTEDEKIITRLVLELTACRRQFNSMYHNAHIERLIFLSGQSVDKEIYTAIAKQMEMPAQMGDCLAAVQIVYPCNFGEKNSCDKANLTTSINKKDGQINWATAFGLSLS